ncbi:MULTISPECIES: alpha/beta hydrolase fold domain-containing protein [Lysinibacillus]|uniref:Alpha/beta hydrolase n=1 Tax=Lysinibacillus capsici TaxID=2115968 RepID=A0ABY8KK13_9BACI|nr:MULTISPECIES: alpha/beta hydrolase [Lysinibacillus]AUS87440.1 esterase [Lysinibacillus sp. YS11]KMN39961.1 esterase [Lysinibacillus sp. LK3]MCT1537763.1 alpha/beta hydrolase [Lysinibacillus capsici]MCT1571787.1 alpha/beta hydrolase [Lysinibacillus capsici]MCT1649056.1 alpha/beta hydrolase [Lysinibacillus capsici]
MSIEIFNGERSVESVQFEKLLFSQSNKKSFSSIENAQQFIKQRGTENIHPYVIGEDVNLLSALKEQTFEDMQVFILNDQKSSSQMVILYIHGGAWTNQPLNLHWLFMDKMAQALNAKVIAPIYPKVPHFSYQDTYPKMLSLYKEILVSIESSNQLTIIGDSAGGNIALGLIQLLKRDGLPQPQDIMLLSACVDMSLENPLIQEYEENDPMLASEGMEVITKIWAADKALKDPIISPIYGDFQGVGKITHFIGSHESLYPDAIQFDEKLTEQGVAINTFVYPKMNHVFVVMPIPEAVDAQQKIINILSK